THIFVKRFAEKKGRFSYFCGHLKKRVQTVRRLRQMAMLITLILDLRNLRTCGRYAQDVTTGRA
ncbi:MAG: hypothetical protein LBK61_09595, partial [Spirochaetaceae bacterium]|nr:hypothetical protein [Spirochaetaceae bacterium]